MTLTHPPYNTSKRGGPSVRNPLPEHVDLAFRYAAEYGDGNVGDIWIEWDIKDEEGKLLEVKQLMVAVSKKHDCCFVVRGTDDHPDFYEHLVWSHGEGSDKMITILDSGCADWSFKAASKVPMEAAIALAKRFVADGYIGDDLEWEPKPE